MITFGLVLIIGFTADILKAFDIYVYFDGAYPPIVFLMLVGEIFWMLSVSSRNK